jgi:hypothetical protein
VALWTGLLVRPDPGVWLRLAATGNRRNTSLAVGEFVVPDGAGFVPLVLELTLRNPDVDALTLHGELACLAPLRPGVRVETLPLDAAPEVGRAHAAFYDPDYFARKRSEVTRKYRRLVARGGDNAAAMKARPASVVCRVVVAGPSSHAVGTFTRFATRDGIAATVGRGGDGAGYEYVVYRNEVAFRALFDGHTVALEPEARALAAGARAVLARWTEVHGADFVAAHRGALLYLTKYFTPHPPGEPHFFVKPWAFTQTPAGWSCVLDGVHGDGYDVMRGVVATDRFFATPAVFRLWREGRAVSVPAGAPLLRVLPVPRALLAAEYRRVGFPDDTAGASAR